MHVNITQWYAVRDNFNVKIACSDSSIRKLWRLKPRVNHIKFFLSLNGKTGEKNKKHKH